MEQITVSPEFDWKTTKNYTLTIAGPYDAILSVESPEGVACQRIFLKKNEPYVMKLTVATSATSVQLKYSGQEHTLLLDASILSYTFN